jgi:hypothetical protein
MLSERFILVLETLLKSQFHSDGAPRVVTTSPHVPIKLPAPTPKAIMPAWILLRAIMASGASCRSSARWRP